MSAYQDHQEEFKESGYLKRPSDNEITAKLMLLDSRLRGNDKEEADRTPSFPRRRESRNRFHWLIADSQINKIRGFTLFELLVVILLISLISALVLPRMAASLPGVQLKSTARAVAASLRYARSQAAFESTPYVAIFDYPQRLLAVEPMEKPLDAAELDRLREILDTSKLEKLYEFPDGVELDVFNSSDADEDRDVFPILFFPRGDSTGGKIVLKNMRGKRYTIAVDPITGTVEIENPEP